MNTNTYAIVIGRQFGCGGREIGKMVADALGIAYYDSELLIETAKNSGVAREYFESKDEKTPSFLSGMLSLTLGFNSGTYLMSNSPLNEDSLYTIQSNVITEIADRGPCVIVGRTADYVLRNHCKVISIFIHATMGDRVKRIIARGDCKTEKEAITRAEKTNKMRSSYYNFYTDKKWGEAETYDLCVNASVLGDKGTADLIIDYVSKVMKK